MKGLRAVRARCNAEASRTLDCRNAEVVKPAGRSNSCRRSKKGERACVSRPPVSTGTNCPSQPRTGPAVHVAIVKNFKKRRIVAVD